MGFHWPELAVVLVVALLVFGPKRLPEMGSAIGKTVQEFRKSMNEIADHPKTEQTPPQAVTQSLPPVNATESATTVDSPNHA